MAARSVVIAKPVRTAIGAFGGTLKVVPRDPAPSPSAPLSNGPASSPKRSRPPRWAMSFRPGTR